MVLLRMMPQSVRICFAVLKIHKLRNQLCRRSFSKAILHYYKNQRKRFMYKLSTKLVRSRLCYLRQLNLAGLTSRPEVTKYRHNLLIKGLACFKRLLSSYKEKLSRRHYNHYLKSKSFCAWVRSVREQTVGFCCEGADLIAKADGINVKNKFKSTYQRLKLNRLRAQSRRYNFYVATVFENLRLLKHGFVNLLQYRIKHLHYRHDLVNVQLAINPNRQLQLRRLQQNSNPCNLLIKRAFNKLKNNRQFLIWARKIEGKLLMSRINLVKNCWDMLKSRSLLRLMNGTLFIKSDSYNRFKSLQKCFGKPLS